MARIHRSVRIDPQLIEQLDEAARSNLVPATFAEQIDAALRLLLAQAAAERTRRSAGLVDADRQQAEATYRRLHGRGGR